MTPRIAALAGPLAAASALAMVALCLAWELWLAPTGSGTLAVKALPIALSVPGLVRGHLRTFRWTSLLVWLYVCEGLVRATSDRGGGVPLAWAEVAIGCVLFAACGIYVRARMRADASAATAATAS